MMEEMKDYVDLYTLLATVKAGLAELFPLPVWVKAEISSLSVKANGHCYLELSQSEDGNLIAKQRATVWRSRFGLISARFQAETGTPLAAGQEVLLQVELSFHELYGLSLNVLDLDPSFTLGNQLLKRQQTIERLEAEGLMDMQKKLGLPAIPYYLAVISAEQAAGFGDFRRHLAGNEYGFAYEVKLFAATMQGEEAPESIRQALSQISASPVRYDAVLILRGGGSELDLACFDDYSLAAAIARFPLPVFTAIGHDRDFHVADMVAYRYVKTPTALADLFIDSTAAEDERISSYETRLGLAFQNRLNALKGAVDILEKAVCSAALRKLDAGEAALRLIEMKISVTDPRSVLSRGFSLALDANGVRLSSAAGSKAGDRISVLFADGRLGATVNEVSKN